MTKVLTVPEIEAIKEYADTDWWYFARAIEAAVIKRLATGVSVEPSFFNVMDGKTAYIPYYTPKQFTTAIAAARVAALEEECARLIEDEEEDGLPLETLANGIRALLGKEQS